MKKLSALLCVAVDRRPRRGRDARRSGLPRGSRRLDAGGSGPARERRSRERAPAEMRREIARLRDERELATYLERLNALAPEDIQRVARKYLKPALAR